MMEKNDEGTNQNAMGDPSVQFPNKGSSSYCKAIVILITLFLLAAGVTVASLLLMSDEFVLSLKLDEEKTFVYQIEQRFSLDGVSRSHHLFSSTASVRIVNRTSSHFWFSLKLSFPVQRMTQMVNASDNEIFLVCSYNSYTGKQTEMRERFEIYSKINHAPEFIHYVENVVEQLFPEVQAIQAKLYGMVFGRNKWRNIKNVVRPSIIPFRVGVHQVVERKSGNVIVVNMFDESDFVGTVSDFWTVSYYERATVVEHTGILKNNLVNLSVSLPYSIRRENKGESAFRKFAVKVSSKVYFLREDKKVNDKWIIEKGPILTEHFARLKKKNYTRNRLNSGSSSLYENNFTNFNSDYQKVTLGTMKESELMYQSPIATSGPANKFGSFPFDLKELIRLPSNHNNDPLPGFVHLQEPITNTNPNPDTTDIQTEQLWSSLDDSDGEPDTEDENDYMEDAEEQSQDNYDYNYPDSSPFDQDEEDNKLQHHLNPTMKRELGEDNPSFPFPFLPPLISPMMPSLTTLDEETSDNRKKKRSIVTNRPSTIAYSSNFLNGEKIKSYQSVFSPSSNLKSSKRKSGNLYKERKSFFRAKRSVSSDLDDVWDLTNEGSMGPEIFPKSKVEIFRQNILGVLVTGEIKNEVKSFIDDYGQSTWQVVQAIYFNVGRFRFTVLKKKHKINKRLKNKLKEERTKHFFVPAGDLIKCTYLSYIRTICFRIRLRFNLTVVYQPTELSPAYPVELNIKVDHKAEIVTSMAVHATSWLLSGGLQWYGTLINLTAPLRLSFREEREPQWCTSTNVTFSEHDIFSFPVQQWGCRDFNKSVHEVCQTFEDRIMKPSQQMISRSSRMLHDGCHSGLRKESDSEYQ